MARWETLARERADDLKSKLEELDSKHIDTKALKHNLARVRAEHIDPDHGFLDWLTGDAINESWAELHRVEEAIDKVWPSVEDLVLDADRHITQRLGSKRAHDVKSVLHAKPADSEKKRSRAVAAIEEAHRSAEERHESERQQQRGVLAIATLLGLAAVALLVVQATMLGGTRLVPAPTSSTGINATGLLALVMLLGLLGGLISALVSLYVTGTHFKDTSWFDPRPGLTVMKLALGLWTGLVGVLAAGTGEIVGVYHSLAAELLLAFTFGYGQQAVTTFLDRKVGALLEEKKG